MKYLFIAVSILFATASAGEGMSGYTESLELPYNPYSNEILPYMFNDEKPHIEMLNHLYGFDQPLESCFSSESPSQNCFIPFSNSEEYCSKHPRICKSRENDSKTPVAYISVKENQGVSLKAHLSNNINDNYCLVLHKYNDNGNNDQADFRHHKIINEGDPSYDIPYEWIKEGGIFKIYPHIGKIKNKKNDKKCNPQTNKQAILAFKVLPYTEIKKNFIYVQLDGKKLETHEEENSFTEERVKNNFNEVFNQAVVYEGLTPQTASDFDKIELEENEIPIKNKVTKEKYKMVNISDLIEIDITNPEDDFIETIKAKALKKFNLLFSDQQKLQEQYRFFVEDQSKVSPYFRMVFVINKERKKWRIKKCGKGNGDLSSCPYFFPEEEHKDTKYRVYSDGTCLGAIDGDKPVTIKIIYDDYGEEHYYAFLEDNTPVTGDCNIIYTDNGYPVFPSKAGVTSNIKGGNLPFLKANNNVPVGSITIAIRGKGESAQYTLIHELGHSFGLADVSMSDIYKILEYDTKSKPVYQNNEGKKDYRLYKNNLYASSETNLMTWQQPTGKKIRYRGTQVVSTGGTDYYTDVDDPNSYVGSIERPFSGNGENQWECARFCYNNDALNSEDRKEYWQKKVYSSKVEDKNKFDEMYENSIKPPKITVLDKKP